MTSDDFMTLGEAHALLAARLPSVRLIGDPGRAFARVHTDTRTLRAGDLFVALRGERFDANDFLAQAREAGACAALAERGLAEAGLPGLEVPDALAALQALAEGWRATLDLPVIGVTGSNGKTTVTQMIAAILRAAAGDAAHATAGNLNNHIGVPLTVLGLRRHHRLAVIELGMNHPGEIAELARIAQPTVALVNNAQREHQEFMKTVEAVARENGAAIAALPAGGTAVFPADDIYTALWRELEAKFWSGGEVGELLHVTRSGRDRRIRLPSGRELVYHGVAKRRVRKKRDDGTTYERDELSFIAPLPNAPRTPTYGGRLTENITQAVARDVLAHALVRLEREGYRVVGHVHDEVLIEGAHDVADVARVMCADVGWNNGLPLGAEGYVTERYRKE